MTRPDDLALRTEWTRLSEHTRPPALTDLRRRSETRLARRNSTIAGTGAAVLAIGALGVTLGGGLGMDPSTEPGSASVASGPADSASRSSVGSPAPQQTQAQGETQENETMPYGIDESRPGMTNPQDDSILARLRRNEDRLNVPFPQSMPQGRALAGASAVAAFAAEADEIYIFSGTNMRLAYSDPPSHAYIHDVREWLKHPATAAAGSSASVALTGSQSPQDSPTALHLVFAKQGRTLALYSINGNYASQVSPVKVSAPGMIRIDELRSVLEG